MSRATTNDLRRPLILGTVVLCSVGLALSGMPSITSAAAAAPPLPSATTTAFFLAGGSITNSGTGDLAVTVETRHGGDVNFVGAAGSGRALRFPDFDPSTKGPRAVVRAVPAGTTDPLNPGIRQFTIGADVNLDDAPTAQAGTSDAGDNVIQRGLFGDVTQYKIEADSGRVVCRMKGRSGVVSAKITPPRIDRGKWYRLACTRDGNLVTLSVTPWTGSAWGAPQVVHSSGNTGDMTPVVASTPLAVGGKLGASGNVSLNSSDQFNGRIANAFVQIASAADSAKHSTYLTVSPNKPHARQGAKVRISGTFLPHNAAAVGAPVTMAFKAPKSPWRTVRTTTIKKTFKFKFKKIKAKPGKYRVKFAGSDTLRPSKAVLRYKAGQFRG